jgi:hypothetical protein
MWNYTRDEARSALADVDLRRRQLAAAARPGLYWPIGLLIAWMITVALLLDLPRTAASAPIFGGVEVLYIAAMIVLSRLRPVRPRVSAMGAGWWLGVLVMAIGAPVVWWLGYLYLGRDTPLPFTVAAGTTGLYLAAATALINTVLSKRDS